MTQRLSFMAEISIMRSVAADVIQRLDGPFSPSSLSQFDGPLADHFDNEVARQLDGIIIVQFENTLSRHIDNNIRQLWERHVMQIRGPIVVALRKIFDREQKW